MILGFDFLGFQVLIFLGFKRFPTKNRIFLHVVQSTITKNSFLLVFYPYVTGMYLVCTRMLLVCTHMYSYVTRMYLYVTRMYSCGVLVMIGPDNQEITFGFIASKFFVVSFLWIVTNKTPHEYIRVTYKYH